MNGFEIVDTDVTNYDLALPTDYFAGFDCLIFEGEF